MSEQHRDDVERELIEHAVNPSSETDMEKTVEARRSSSAENRDKSAPMGAQ
jgi:hypothetical protein